MNPAANSSSQAWGMTTFICLPNGCLHGNLKIKTILAAVCMGWASGLVFGSPRLSCPSPQCLGCKHRAKAGNRVRMSQISPDPVLRGVPWGRQRYPSLSA